MPESVAPKDFRWVKLSELARLESGHTPSRKRSEYWDGDIPWIGIRDATENHGRAISFTHQQVTQLGIDNSSARVLPEGTVCLSRTASVGYVVMMGRPMATSQDFVNWVCGPDLNPRYLKYILQLEQDSVRRFAHGTTHQTMYYPEAKALHVCIPSKCEQDRIAGVLGALDDLIEVNTQLMANLMKLSDAAFEKWAMGVTKQVRAADVMTRASDSVAVSNIEENVTYLGLEHFALEAAGLIGRGVGTGLESNKLRFLPGDVLYGKLRPYFRKVARPGFGGVCTTELWVLRAKGAATQAYVHWLVRKGDFTKYAMAGSEGTKMPRASWEHVAGFLVPDPEAPGMQMVASTAEELWRAASELEIERDVLAAARDELLPLLMSGRVRVGEVAA
jgi:type I restriction enzyme S subunit